MMIHHGTIDLTEEQHEIVASRSEALRVMAFAGTGKTATLRAYAQARPQQRLLYVAFNRAVALEARLSFPAHVCCTTIHALAYRAIGHRYRQQLRGTLRPHQLAAALGLDPSRQQDLLLTDQALRVLQHFHCSSSRDLAGFAADLTAADLAAGRGKQRYSAAALQAAARLWQLMADPADPRVPMTHDGYLKLYQLSDPQLRFDVILLDEAQDTNPVTLAILEQQGAARVFVGDPHQQIYQFRHATNAMAAPGQWDELALTGSFRFAEEIAAAANRLLLVKGEARRVRGLRDRPVDHTTAFLARGNAALFQKAVGLAQNGARLHWCGGLKGYRHAVLLDLWQLQQGEIGQIRDRFIAGFGSYDQLREYAEQQDVRDLKAWCQLLERRRQPGAGSIPEQIALLQRCAVDTQAEGVISLATAHKSKGLEFGVVELADDFCSHALLDQPAGGVVVLPEEELNLRYVAVTRAQAECRSSLWPAPLFADLAAYVEAHPRFRLVASIEELKPPAKRREQECEEEQIWAEEQKPQSVEAAMEPQPLAWFLGPLDANHVEVISCHYGRKHPALNWDWLLHELCQLRVVSGDPAGAVGAWLEEQQLGSAQALISRFLLDVGLVLPEEAAGLDQQNAEVDPEAIEHQERRSVRKRLVSLWRSVKS